jgi:hypothetical protein
MADNANTGHRVDLIFRKLEPILQELQAISGGTATGLATETTLASVLATLQGQFDYESDMVEDSLNVIYEQRRSINQDTGVVTITYHNPDGTTGTPTPPLTFLASNISTLATEVTLNAVNTTLDDTANQIVKLVDQVEVDEDGTPATGPGIYRNFEFYRIFNRETGAVVTNINAAGGTYTVSGAVSIPPVLMGDAVEYTDGTDTYLVQHYSDGTIIATLIGGTTVKYTVPSGFSRTGATVFTSVSNTIAANLAAGYKAVLFDFAGLDTHTATVNGETFTKNSPALVLNYGDSNRLSPQISYVVSDAAAVLKIKTIA